MPFDICRTILRHLVADPIFTTLLHRMNNVYKGNNAISGKRLEYFDALRGVAMLAVIYYHLCVYLLCEGSVINESLVRWRMPAFFFVSGFFSYSPCFDTSLFHKRTKNRLTRQLWPTVVIWFVFVICSWLLGEAGLKEHILHGIYDPAKVGYWFTFSMVNVFVFYAVLAYLMNYFSLSILKQTAVYGAIISFFCILSFVLLDMEFKGMALTVWNVLSLGKTIPLVAFFFAGVLVKMHWDVCFKLFDNKWFLVGSLLIFGTLSFLPPGSEVNNSLVYYGSRVSGLAFVISVFVNFRVFFESDTRVGQYLRRIGRNTLPIYLFHFFILLLIIHFVDDVQGVMRSLSPNPFVELLSFTVISVIFAEICLGFESLLKLVPSAHKLVFSK